MDVRNLLFCACLLLFLFLVNAFFFMHSKEDEVFPVCNYESVKEKWGADRIYGMAHETNFNFGWHDPFTFVYHIGIKAYENTMWNHEWKPGEK